MNINYDKAYTIKEFSDLTGVPQNTLRNWEEKLQEAFPVPRDPHQNRFYTDRHLTIVNLIQKWRDSEFEFTFTQIKEMLLRLQEEGRFQNQSFDAEDMGPGLVAVSRDRGSGIPTTNQILQVQQMVTNMEDRMQQFFGQLDSALQKHAESTQKFIKQEIESFKEHSDNNNEKIISDVQTKFQERFTEESKRIGDNVISIKETLTTDSKAALQEQMDRLVEGARSELQRQMEEKMTNWAVISKEELEGIRNKKKKGFLGWFSKD